MHRIVPEKNCTLRLRCGGRWRRALIVDVLAKRWERTEHEERNPNAYRDAGEWNSPVTVGQSRLKTTAESRPPRAGSRVLFRGLSQIVAGEFDSPASATNFVGHHDSSFQRFAHDGFELGDRFLKVG